MSTCLTSPGKCSKHPAASPHPGTTSRKQLSVFSSDHAEKPMTSAELKLFFFFTVFVLYLNSVWVPTALQEMEEL